MAKAKIDETVTDIEIRVEPKTPLVFDHNFDEAKKLLKKKLTKYKGLQVTDANFEHCKFVQKQCVTTRTLLESKRKDCIKAFIDLPKDMLQAQFKELQALVAEVEDNIAKQMDVYEQERIRDVRTAIQGYVDEFQDKYKLLPRFLDTVELKKQYFNKTAKEAETIADIESQFKDAQREQQRFESDCAMIRSTVGNNKLFNADKLIEQLEYKTASQIVMEINEEKDRINGVAKEIEDSGVTPVLGTNNDTLLSAIGADDFGEFSGVTKTMKVKIVYPEELGKTIQDFFKKYPSIEVTKL